MSDEARKLLEDLAEGHVSLGYSSCCPECAENLALVESALQAAAERERERASVYRGLLERVFAAWSFDDSQQHAHTWHDREDLYTDWTLAEEEARLAALEGGE